MKLLLTDKNNEHKAEVLVESFEDNLVQGIIVSHTFDKNLIQKITEFEELVNSFVIGELLDEITDQLDAYNWQVTGKNWVVCNLQVFNKKDISFRIKQPNNNVLSTTDLIAELQFLNTEQGGRKNPVTSGYRPHIEFEEYPEYLTSGQQTYIGQQTVAPGETVLAEISILSKDYFTNRLYENMKFEFYEGKHKIGSGKVLEIVNVRLKMK
ncbi:hypothetical protein [uncultured Aquimarina sp.]|uniref:hypothetical protein n=1 Tax=uncultured Aquimarina sp. TaxID=575652 RepID=UPI002610CBAD|nr:hypothetical protein [uncultured Aquimarina sp.]